MRMVGIVVLGMFCFGADSNDGSLRNGTWSDRSKIAKVPYTVEKTMVSTRNGAQFQVLIALHLPMVHF